MFEKILNTPFRNVSLLNTKVLQSSNTKNEQFLNMKSVPFSNTKNKSVSNTKTCRFQIRRLWSLGIFRYECYLCLQQTAHHTFNITFYVFYQTFHRNHCDIHVWLSIFTRSAQSTFTRVQRLTSVLSLSMMTLLANAMFHHQEVG